MIWWLLNTLEIGALGDRQTVHVAVQPIKAEVYGIHRRESKRRDRQHSTSRHPPGDNVKWDITPMRGSNASIKFLQCQLFHTPPPRPELIHSVDKWTVLVRNIGERGYADHREEEPNLARR